MKKKYFLVVLLILSLVSSSGCFKQDTKVNKTINKAGSVSTEKQNQLKEQLTANYFIPNNFGQIKYSIVDNDPEGETKRFLYSTWSVNKDTYTNMCSDNSGEYTSTYELTTSGINWISNTSAYYESEILTDTIAKGNKCVEFKFVSPGGSWKNQYKILVQGEGAEDQYYNYEQTIMFLGFEKISVMGEQRDAAHVQYTRNSSNNSNVEDDSWYVKGLGRVLSKSTVYIDGQKYTSTLTMISD